MDVGLYVHVPFCASKCGYCDFYSRVLNPAAVSKDREDYTPGMKLSACLEKLAEGPVQESIPGGSTGLSLASAAVRGSPWMAALRALKPSQRSTETPSGQPMSAENAARAAKIKELQQANGLLGQQRNPAAALATRYPEQARK